MTLLGWQALARDPSLDTWHDGRFLEKWADERALREFRFSFTCDGPASIAAALWRTVDLFERLERECARLLGFPLPVPHAEVRRRLAEMLGPADPGAA